MSKAKQVPLAELLDAVPEDIVLGIPGDEPVFKSYTNIPIGRCAKQAASLLRQQDEALKMALESMCWAARVLNINEDEAPEFFKSITKLKELT